MKKFRYIFYFAIAVLFISACKEKVTEGYLADGLIYQSKIFPIDPGFTYQSPVPELAYTTVPLKVTVVRITDENGNETDAITKPMPYSIWTKAFDPGTDTTIQLLRDKRKDSLSPSMIFNEKNGQFAITEASRLQKPATYWVDLKLENSAGVRYQNKAFAIKFTTKNYNWQEGITAWNYNGIWRSNDDCEIEYIQKPKHPDSAYYSVWVVWVDKNGNRFSPKNKEVDVRPGRPSYDSRAFWMKIRDKDKDFNNRWNWNDTSMYFKVPFFPFPFAKDPQWDWRNDMVIYKEYVNIDGETPNVTNVYVYYPIQLLAESDWIIRIKYKKLTRVPKVI